MLKASIIDLLNRQVNAEIWSAYLYLSMSLHAEYKGLEGMANWFYVQWLEELEHSRIIQKYLISHNAEVLLSPIAEVPRSWESPLKMFEDALYNEYRVTKRIHMIVEQAQRESDFATISRMQWFIDEQVEEEASLSSIIGRLRYYDEQPFAIYGIDNDLQMRKYKPASPLAEC